jgi:hypothetical protein
MVLMNGSKKARRAASMSNQTSHFGIMGGTAPLTGKTWAVRNAIIKKGNYCNCIGGEQIPSGPVAGLAFLIQKQALSVNPQCTGGVGRLSSTRYGGCGKL